MTATPAPAPERQAFISFARGLSMFSIVLYHFLLYVPLPPLLAKANQIGGAGIYIFLFASSYGLYYSRISSWKSFYLSRFKKVLFPYYIGITVIFIVNQFLALYPEGWPAYLSHLFLYKMFYGPYMESFGPHFWFISTIVQFYLLWPLLRALDQRLPTPTLLAVCLAVSLLYSVLVFRLGVQQERIWCSSVIQYFWILALGMAAARHNWIPRILQLGLLRHAVLLVVGLGMSVLVSVVFGPEANIFNDYFMFIGYFSGCVLLFLVGQQLSFIVRSMLWLNTFSYSLYIIHLFIFILYLKALAKTSISLMEVPVVMALCIVLALLFDKLVSQLTDISFGRTQPVLRT
ncbi:hypothetical protein GCM10027511_08770 [Hymenobacter humi]